MLRSSNPILSKKDAFTPASNQYGQQQFGGQQQYGAAAVRAAAVRAAASPYGSGQPLVQDNGARMTFDDVLTKTAIVMGLLIASAAVSWNVMPAPVLPSGAGAVRPGRLRHGHAGVVQAQGLAALVFAYAIIEGVFIGMISKFFEGYYPGIVTQAVIGTFVAAGMTLAAYKIFNIRVTPKFRKVLFISTAAFAGAMLLNFVLYLFGIDLGLRSGVTGSVSLLAIGISALGVVLAVLNLVLDFDYIERGVEMGAPAEESWRAAFGLTVTMVWLYIEILRILSYLRR